ncbi:MAG: 30S ribosomal protein S12 methylthiotransferase RimO [Proteobacteria bacterium]|nr:30S ribosomal protein S12 methylthiotransferase RimO [Pseudomonadota bacterium]
MTINNLTHITQNTSLDRDLSESAHLGELTLVHFITLGCARNRVDSEVMLGSLLSEGWQYTDDPGLADMIIINTCGFIKAAKEESIDTILEMSEYKKQAKPMTLIVAGCLTQRYKKQLMAALPEVDIFIGSDQFAELPRILKEHQKSQNNTDSPPKKIYAQRTHAIYTDVMPRVNTLHQHSAYVKVAEGCDHNCAFCIIPAIRGRLRSRPLGSVVKECTELAQRGVVEINLIAQDLAAYGRDLNQNNYLLDLLQELVQINDITWIRLLYAYPENLTDDFLQFFACEDKLVKYLDIPMQHGSDHILSKMKRDVTAKDLLNIVRQVRKFVPNITLRTSVMVGFPGETEEDFLQLRSFVQEIAFDHLGCFTYSREEGTLAGAMDQQVPDDIKKLRRDEIMDIQRGISQHKLQALIGQKQAVFLEKKLDTNLEEPMVQLENMFHDLGAKLKAKDSFALWQGRLSGQAPEVDGKVFVIDSEKKCGTTPLVYGRITETSEYDALMVLCE